MVLAKVKVAQRAAAWLALSSVVVTSLSGVAQAGYSRSGSISRGRTGGISLGSPMKSPSGFGGGGGGWLGGSARATPAYGGGGSTSGTAIGNRYGGSNLGGSSVAPTRTAPIQSTAPRTNASGLNSPLGGNGRNTDWSGASVRNSGTPPSRPMNAPNGTPGATSSATSGTAGRTLPPGAPANAIPTRNGGYKVNNGASEVHYRPDGSRERMVNRNEKGETVQRLYRKDGSLAQHSVGDRTTNFKRDGSKVVIDRSTGTRQTFDRNGNLRQGSRNYERDGRRFTERATYGNNNTTVIRNYENHYWGGGYAFSTFSPVLGFATGFLAAAVITSWALHPIHYAWPYYAHPWYGYYGYYFAPYPYYPAPSYWVTDHMISTMLAERYAAEKRVAVAQADAAEARADAAEARADAERARADAAEARRETAITPAMKDQINKQVAATMHAFEKEKRAIPLPEVMGDTQHLFPVSDEREVTMLDSDKTCSLSDGDLVRLATPASVGDKVADMVVVTSKKGSCPAGTHFKLSITDLQEFHNEFSARVEDGLKAMAKDKEMKSKLGH